MPYSKQRKREIKRGHVRKRRLKLEALKLQAAGLGHWGLSARPEAHHWLYLPLLTPGRQPVRSQGFDPARERVPENPWAVPLPGKDARHSS